MTFDTLTYNGIEQPLAAWGFDLASCRGVRKNSSADTFTGRIPQATIVGAPLFPAVNWLKKTGLGLITLQTGRVSATGAANSFGAIGASGTVKFVGKCFTNPMKAGGQAQGAVFEFHGPFQDLLSTQYLQLYNGVNESIQPGEVVLNVAGAPQTTQGVRFISIGDQVQCILQFVLDQYKALGLTAPFQYKGRALLNGTVNLDCTGITTPSNANTDVSGNIYNLKLQANPTIDPALYTNWLKSEIIRPMSAAECLQKVLDSSPRTNVAFDYTTTPPTCWVYNVDNLAAVTLPIFDGVNHKEMDIQRRDDLQPASVIIGYRITDTINGASDIDYKQDKWGPNGYNSALDPSAGPGVVAQTLDLTGFSITFTTAQMDCEPLECIGGTNATKRAWWSSRRGGEQAKLLDSRVRFQDLDKELTNPLPNLEVQIPDATLTYATTDNANGRVAGQPLSPADLALFANRIVQGSYHDWMAQQGIFALKVRVTANVRHAIWDVVAPGDTINQPPVNESQSNNSLFGNKNTVHTAKEFHVNLQLTNASNPSPGVKASFTTLASETPGEAFILGAGGIAQYLFTMLSVLQYEGSYVKVETQFANNVSLLNRLNLSAGLPEWTTMGAQIQEITEHWGTKETSVKIGVSKHLSGAQLSAFLNMWRFRRTWYNPAIRSDNTAQSNGEVEMPDNTGGANSTEGVGTPQSQTLLNYLTPPTATQPGVITSGIILDSTKASFLDTINAV